MLLGFKKQFEPYILDGSKTHTIRGIRKIAPKVGETCHCYGDIRQKSMHLLGRWPCVRIESIFISDDGRVRIAGMSLESDERDMLAWRDGFRHDASGAFDIPHVFGCFALMLGFWQGRLPFEGQIIHWDFTRPVRRVRSTRNEGEAGCATALDALRAGGRLR